MSNFDPAKPPIEIRLECSRSGHRQTIDLRLKDSLAFDELESAMRDQSECHSIPLADGTVFVLDMTTVWYIYPLDASQTWNMTTLRLGGIQ